MEKYRLLAPIDFWPYTYREKYPNLYYTQILNPGFKIQFFVTFENQHEMGNSQHRVKPEESEEW